MSTDRQIGLFAWGLFTGFGISAALVDQYLVSAFFAMIAFGFGYYAIGGRAHD